MSKDKEEKSSSFLTQAIILAGAGLLVRVIGFLYRLPITNMMGDEGMGIYTAGYNIYNFFFIMSSAGLPAAISKMVSTRMAVKQYKNAHRVFKTSLIFASGGGLLFALLLYFGAGFLSNISNSPNSYYAIVTLAPTVFIVAVMSVFRGYFQGMNNTVPTSISQIVEQIFNAIFSIYLVYILLDRGLPYAAAGGTAATGIGALAGLVVVAGIYLLASRRIKIRMQKERTLANPETPGYITKELVMTAFPIIAGTAVYSMTSIIDTNMVKGRLMFNNAFTYEQAEALFGQLGGKYVTLTNLPVAISASMATAVIPSIAASVTLNDRQAANNKINLAIKLAMIISIPAAFGLGIFAEQILLLLFPRTNTGAELLKVGFISVIFFSLSQISTGVLQGIGKLHIPVVAAFVGCIFKVILNYVLIAIPALNIIGAIIATTVCYMISSGVNTYFAYKFTGSKPDISGVFIKPVVSSIIMSMVCYVLFHTIYQVHPSNTIALLVSIFVGVATYLICMLVLGGITREDLAVVPMGKTVVRLMDMLGL